MRSAARLFLLCGRAGLSLFVKPSRCCLFLLLTLCSCGRLARSEAYSPKAFVPFPLSFVMFKVLLLCLTVANLVKKRESQTTAAIFFPREEKGLEAFTDAVCQKPRGFQRDL